MANSDNTQGTPFDHISGIQEGGSSHSSTSSSISKLDPNLVQSLAQEMMRLVKGQQGIELQSNNPNAFAHFAGMDSTGSHSHISCVVLNGT